MTSGRVVCLCSIHRFELVPMPRDAKGDDRGFCLKCPLKGCMVGVRKRLQAQRVEIDNPPTEQAA